MLDLLNWKTGIRTDVALGLQAFGIALAAIDRGDFDLAETFHYAFTRHIVWAFDALERNAIRWSFE